VVVAPVLQFDKGRQQRVAVDPAADRQGLDHLRI